MNTRLFVNGMGKVEPARYIDILRDVKLEPTCLDCDERRGRRSDIDVR